MDFFNITQLQPDDWLLQKDPADSVRALQRENESADPQRLKDAAKRFEGLFVHQILKQMKETTASLEPEEDEESFGDSSSEHIKSMFWTFLADAVTEQGGFGLWENIYEQMASQLKSQEADGNVQLDEQI